MTLIELNGGTQIILWAFHVLYLRTILDCPLTDQGTRKGKEERLAQEKKFAELEEQLKLAEEQKQKLAQEKLAALNEAKRIEEELKNAHMAHADADDDNIKEIEAAKEAIKKLQQEAEKAKQ